MSRLSLEQFLAHPDVPLGRVVALFACTRPESAWMTLVPAGLSVAGAFSAAWHACRNRPPNFRRYTSIVDATEVFKLPLVKTALPIMLTLVVATCPRGRHFSTARGNKQIRSQRRPIAAHRTGRSTTATEYACT